MSESYDVVVVGAGFTGCTVANGMAKLGKRVCVVDSRDIVGGTSADEVNKIGNLVSLYGPHAFHTNSPRVWEYLQEFSAWIPYEQRSKTCYQGELFDIPINANTIEKFFGVKFDTEEACREFLNTKIIRDSGPIQNSYELAISIMGPDLFNAFYRNYTFKQWNRHAAHLSRTVIGRLPVRTNRDDRYFTDKFQGLPAFGYTMLMARMLDGCDTILGQEISLKQAREMGKEVIWTGALDQAFEYSQGHLPWRSLRFEQIISTKKQVASVIHEADFEVTHTRTMDASYFGPKYELVDGRTTLLREWSASEGEKFYPILEATHDGLLNKYSFLAGNMENVHFLGRLGRFRYINMDQAISDALHFMDHYKKVSNARIYS